MRVLYIGCRCCSSGTELQFACNFGGIVELIAVFNRYLSCICIIIKTYIYISSSVTAYPQIVCGVATFLNLRHGELHAVRGLWRPRGSSSTSGERGEEGGLFCAVWSCWTDGISSHRSITFRSLLFLLKFEMLFTSCGATLHLGSCYQHCYRSY